MTKKEGHMANTHLKTQEPATQQNQTIKDFLKQSKGWGII